MAYMALDTVRETGSKNMELYIQLIPNCSLFILQVYLSWQDSHLANVCGPFSQVPGSVVGTESSVLSSPPLGTLRPASVLFALPWLHLCP